MGVKSNNRVKPTTLVEVRLSCGCVGVLTTFFDPPKLKGDPVEFVGFMIKWKSQHRRRPIGAKGAAAPPPCQEMN